MLVQASSKLEWLFEKTKKERKMMVSFFSKRTDNGFGCKNSS